LEYVASLLPKFSEVSALNIGGGLGVSYKEGEQLSDPEQLYEKVRVIMAKW
jgi:diaminopimelate decarboxylase